MIAVAINVVVGLKDNGVKMTIGVVMGTVIDANVNLLGVKMVNALVELTGNGVRRKSGAPRNTVTNRSALMYRLIHVRLLLTQVNVRMGARGLMEHVQHPKLVF